MWELKNLLCSAPGFKKIFHSESYLLLDFIPSFQIFCLIIYHEDVLHGLAFNNGIRKSINLFPHMTLKRLTKLNHYFVPFIHSGI